MTTQSMTSAGAQALTARCWKTALVLCLAGGALTACSPGPEQARSATSAGSKTPVAVAVARGKIDVEGGLQELSVATEGVVAQLAVGEGQTVQPGQLLLRLADASAKADALVAQSEWQLAQARLKAKSERLPALQQSLARWKAALSEGAADAQSVDEAAQALRDAQAEQAVAAAELQVADHRRGQLQAQQARLLLKAPQAATVVRVAQQLGSHAMPSRPAVVLLPHSPLLVRAELNEAYAGAVRVGMRATVVADGDGSAVSETLPGAKVLRISPVYATGRLQEDGQRGPVRVIECVLAFDQPPAQARVGLNVRVSFHE